MSQTPIVIHKLVKGEDVNHHGTLFAGRGAEWFVEAGFIAAASLTDPKNVVCVKIHGMTFSRPARGGCIVRYESQVVLAGRSRLISYVRACQNGNLLTEGFLTFVHVDEHGKSLPHGVEIIPETEREIELYEQALQL
jgi:acyl-CoA hydrolase